MVTFDKDLECPLLCQKRYCRLLVPCFMLGLHFVFLPAGASQWSRSAGQTALSPNYEGGLHALVSFESYYFLQQITETLTKQYSIVYNCELRKRKIILCAWWNFFISIIVHNICFILSPSTAEQNGGPSGGGHPCAAQSCSWWGPLRSAQPAGCCLLFHS